MTIMAKQEWCPLCSMVHEPDLHIHEQYKELKEWYCRETTRADLLQEEVDKLKVEIEQLKSKYNV